MCCLQIAIIYINSPESDGLFVTQLVKCLCASCLWFIAQTHLNDCAVHGKQHNSFKLNYRNYPLIIYYRYLGGLLVL